MACEGRHSSQLTTETRLERGNRGGSREHAGVFSARAARAWKLELGHEAA
jgi:hypothetical protein